MQLAVQALRILVLVTLLAVGTAGVVHAQEESELALAETAGYYDIPEIREMDGADRDGLVAVMGEVLGRELPRDAELMRAGAYRVVSAEDLALIERTDTGSIAFELREYGMAALDPAFTDDDLYLETVVDALTASGLMRDDMTFSGFLDEFAGQADVTWATDIDVRDASRLVGRVASFERSIDSVPVFASELIVGLMPDGSIGRLRLHWPELSDHVIDEALSLDQAVESGAWELPRSMSGDDVEIIAVEAGVEHSDFAEPETEVAPVVRVVFRSSDPEWPVASTGVRYFDEAGREVLFKTFPPVESDDDKAK